MPLGYVEGLQEADEPGKPEKLKTMKIEAASVAMDVKTALRARLLMFSTMKREAASLAMAVKAALRARLLMFRIIAVMMGSEIMNHGNKKSNKCPR